MSKKIILLALAAASVAAFALPATAAAAEVDTTVHVVPPPVGTKTIHGVGSATLSGALGVTITCPVSKGTATFSSGTTGTFEQTFGSEASPCKNESGKVCTTTGQPKGVITTEMLEFHLVTVVHTGTGATGPGILVTPNAGNGKFASFTCEGGLANNVEGNGLVGTITKPECGKEASEATVSFTSSGTVQTHKTVASEEVTEGGVVDKKHTPTEYSLKAFGFNAGENAHGTITLGSNAKLECT